MRSCAYTPPTGMTENVCEYAGLRPVFVNRCEPSEWGCCLAMRKVLSKSRTVFLLCSLCLALFFSQQAMAEPVAVNNLSSSTVAGTINPANTTASTPTPLWRTLADGLELSVHTALHLVDGTFQPARGEDIFAVVRIDPEKYEFFLYMASEHGSALSLADWAKQKGLLAAINASMYLPDKSTSTGHMQSLTHVNNERIGGRLGAFFLAEPLNGEGNSLPLADIIERDHPEWAERLNSYAIRVQNFRLVTTGGHIPWKKDGPAHSIAAIATDAQGRILFAFSEYPMPIATFAEYLLLWPDLNIQTAMYVEGSDDSGLFVIDEQQHPLVWAGRTSVLNTKNPQPVPLPNILGIRAR